MGRKKAAQTAEGEAVPGAAPGAAPGVVIRRDDNVSPLSGPVLLIALALTSQALWGSLVDGSMALSEAIVRLLIAWGATWVAVSLLAALVGPVKRKRPEPEDPADP
ncbi:MAG: hypothetical protein ACRDP1_10140 [Nocardioidaceae bacterium]